MEALVRAHEVASAFYRRELLEQSISWPADLLVRRHLNALLEPRSTWSVGYAPDQRNGLVEHLRAAGFDDDTMLAAGLAKVTRSGHLADRFRDRITFVAHDINLRPVGFVARARVAEPKYLNSPNTQIYVKGRSLVGIGAQLERLATGAIPVMVEGPTDAVAVSLISEQWAGISACGTAITRHQAAIVRRHSVGDTAIIMLDADLAGRRSALATVEALSHYFKTVLVGELPEGHDPASLFKSSPKLLDATLGDARLGMEFAIDLELARWEKVLDHVSGQVGALRSVAPMVVRLPNDRVASQVSRLAQHLRLEERVVSREVLACVGPRRGFGASADDVGADGDLESRTP